MIAYPRFWSRHYKWIAGAGMVLGAAAAMVLLLEENRSFDIPVAIQQCSTSCQPELMEQAANSASPVFKLTALDVEDLCSCSCAGAFRRMTPGQFARLEKMNSVESVRADKEVRGLFDEAFKGCYPIYAK